jgi:predicted CXXCH cytochrome family protein
MNMKKKLKSKYLYPWIIPTLNKRIMKLMVFMFVPCLVTATLFTQIANGQLTDGIPRKWSPETHLTWIGQISGSPDDLLIIINDNPIDTGNLIINKYADTAHIRIPLEHGSNLISINEGDNMLFSADIYSASKFEARLVPEEYIFSPFHTDANEESCLSCHRMRVENTDISSKTADNICLPCHNQEFSGLEFQHKSDGVNWGCLECHQTEAMETNYSPDVPIKYAIEEGLIVAPLCYQCHKDNEIKYGEYNYVHGPVSMGGCTMCHNPHGSNVKGFLRNDISEMCIECHRMQDVLKMPLVHKPVLKEGCTRCHAPHGSNFKFFLADEVKEICLKCHPKTEEQKNNHPVTGHPVSGPVNPNDPDQPFSCASCHNPHASNFDKLLPKEELMMICMICHR